jgi:hypothetical protein
MARDDKMQSREITAGATAFEIGFGQCEWIDASIDESSFCSFSLLLRYGMGEYLGNFYYLCELLSETAGKLSCSPSPGATFSVCHVIKLLVVLIFFDLKMCNATVGRICLYGAVERRLPIADKTTVSQATTLPRSAYRSIYAEQG